MVLSWMNDSGLSVEEMKAVIAKLIPGRDQGHLADHTVTLHRCDLAAGVGDDPFAALDLDGSFRVIANRDHVNKAVGPIRRRGGFRVKDDILHKNFETGRLDEIRSRRHSLKTEDWDRFSLPGVSGRIQAWQGQQHRPQNVGARDEEHNESLRDSLAAEHS